MITQVASLQATCQIAFAAKNENTARKGLLIGGILIIPAGFLCAVFGIVAAAHPEIFPENASTMAQRAALALPTIAASLSPFIGGIFLAALWAADISTAVGLLMGCSTLAIEDIVKKVYKKPISEKSELLVSRITVLFVSVLALLLALGVQSIVATITTALAMMASFTILILANIFCPKFCKKSAGIPMIVASLLLWIYWTYIPGNGAFKEAFGRQLVYPEWILCLAIFIVCAIFGKEPAGKLIPQEEK
jgi:SSS family solute:Na+ symporter